MENPYINDVRDSNAAGTITIARDALNSLKKLNLYNPEPVSSLMLLCCLINNDKELIKAFKNEKLDIIQLG